MSFRESDCPGNVLSGKRLSGKMTIRETSFRESDFPGNVRKTNLTIWLIFAVFDAQYVAYNHLL